MIDTQHDECMCVRQLERKVARLERSEYEYKRFVWMLVTTAGGHVTITDELMNDYNELVF